MYRWCTTWGLSGGVVFALNDHAEPEGKVTYLGFGDITTTDDGVTVTVMASETLSFRLGLRYKF